MPIQRCKCDSVQYMLDLFFFRLRLLHLYTPALTAETGPQRVVRVVGRARAGQCNPEFNQVIAPLYTNQQTALES